jgi:nucleotide-binding universal stress UspA family protein
MFRRVMVPVDLAHAGRLEPAVAEACRLVDRDGAELIFVGVTGSQPSAVARTPEEYRQKLAAWATERAAAHGVTTARAEAEHLHDVATDLDKGLIAAATRLGVDLIVMGSHVPGALEHVIGSNAGYVAAHAPMSVMVLRS